MVASRQMVQRGGLFRVRYLFILCPMVLAFGWSSTSQAVDCNSNGVEDATDIAAGTSADCNTNGIPDDCDVAGGTSDDCNLNSIPDDCELAAESASDCDTNGELDECDVDSFAQIAKLTASDAAEFDEFGDSVAVSRDTMFIGALLDDDAGSGSGSVYVFRRSAGAWQEVAKLTASDAAAADWFGDGVSISGDTAVIGARRGDVGVGGGSAYVFREVAGVWQEIAKLTASDAAADDRFGGSVSISGHTALIGAPLDDDGGTNSGSAYVFREVGGAWQEVAKLTASDAAAGDIFGISVSISGNTAIVGARANDDAGTGGGSAYMFREVAGVWQEIAQLTASDAETSDFGFSVSINGATVLIGAHASDDFRGSAYVFREMAGAWQQIAKLTASDAAAWDLFGVSVSLSGQTAVIGAVFDDDGGSQSGSAYVFREVAGVWQEAAKLTASDLAAGDEFGASVSISGNTVVVGADHNDDAGLLSGSAYVFDPSFDANSNGAADVCEPDCNTNGVPDDLDILNGASTDCNANGVPDECDVNGGTSDDCNLNVVPDDCELVAGSANDCSTNGVLDECDILGGTSDDCDLNDVPDDCELAAGSASDCNPNGVLDECDILGGTSDDCNLNSIPDDCELAAGSATDCNVNGVPDVCDVDSFAQVVKFTASDAAEFDIFGVSVSISGNTAIVGAHLEDHPVFDQGNGTNAGSAYLFRNAAGVWQQTAKLTAADGWGGDEFGFSVSLSGDTAVVGARGDGGDSGSAYVFREVAGVWQEIAKLSALEGAQGDEFGSSVSLSGETAVIGAPLDDDGGTNRGSAYVFREVGGVWQQIAKLTASDPQGFFNFGRTVSISGSSAVIGANGFSGSAYVFREVDGVWQQVARIISLDAGQGDDFGRSVSLSGDTAVIGGGWDLEGGVVSRSAYIFREVAGAWQQIAKLTASDAAATDEFGISVSISGNTAVIGASRNDDVGAESGSAYVFREVAGVWHEVGKLTASDAAAGDEFGSSVSISGDTAVIGAWMDDDGGADSGSAYVLDFTNIGADCNANAVPDECDLIAAFDFNADSAINLADYAGFAECLAGPDAPPAPAVSECAGICLDAFDSDLDGDVDLADIAAFQVEFEGGIP